jgi:hypothetical protein
MLAGVGKMIGVGRPLPLSSTIIGMLFVLSMYRVPPNHDHCRDGVESA